MMASSPTILTFSQYKEGRQEFKGLLTWLIVTTMGNLVYTLCWYHYHLIKLGQVSPSFDFSSPEKGGPPFKLDLIFFQCEKALILLGVWLTILLNEQ